jgi:hypothetical protein
MRNTRAAMGVAFAEHFLRWDMFSDNHENKQRGGTASPR